MKYKYIFSLFTILFISLILSINANATGMNEYNNRIFPNAAYRKGIEPPFSTQNGEDIQIDPATGDLVLSKTDLYLEGRNGLDVSITRYYMMSGSNIWEHQVGIDSYGSLYDVLNMYTFNDKFYNIGAGWALDFPFVEIRGGWPYLHYGSAGSWDMSNFNQTENCYYPKGENVLKDITLQLDLNRSYTNGQTLEGVQLKSLFIMPRKDGKKYYFSDTGLLLGIVDRFGNEIKFFYTVETDEYYAKHYVLSKITDTCQRDINFQYDKVNNKVVITISDGSTTKTIYYNLAKITEKTSITVDGFMPPIENVLDSVTDAEGRTTTYEYAYNLTKASMLYRNINSGLGNMHVCLQKILYPSGSYTWFLNPYKYVKNFGPDGVMEWFKEITKEPYSSTGGRFNSKYYLYNQDNTWEHDGYPYYSSEESIPSSYNIKTRVESVASDAPPGTEIFTFNKYLRDIFFQDEGYDHKIEISKEYDTRKLPIKSIKKIYNKSTGQYMERIENLTYDNYKDITGYWDEQAARDANNMPLNDEHKTSYTYHPAYHYITGKIYKKDANATIQECYIPTTDGKKIEWAYIYENSELKKKSGYIYDTYGNVVEERNYFEDWSAFIPIKYSYTDNVTARNGKLNGAYLTGKRYEDITDADNNLVEARSGNSAGTVDEIYNPKSAFEIFSQIYC